MHHFISGRESQQGNTTGLEHTGLFSTGATYDDGDDGDDYDDSDDVKMMMHHNVTSICVQCEYKLELHILTITSISSSFAGLAYKDRTEHR